MLFTRSSENPTKNEPPHPAGEAGRRTASAATTAAASAARRTTRPSPWDGVSPGRVAPRGGLLHVVGAEPRGHGAHLVPGVDRQPVLAPDRGRLDHPAVRGRCEPGLVVLRR